MAIDLNGCGANVFSQHGEDGILARLFEVLGIERGFFCELGAWDGKHLSNTYALYERGWSGCYIEGDRTRFQALQANVDTRRVVCVNAFVEAEGPNTLDNILRRVAGGERPQVHLLSIDIDSDDLALWRSLRSVRPLVVVIEYNPTIPRDVEFENTPGKNYGNSCRSIYEFAQQAEYDLVAATQTNLIFVDRVRNPGVFKVYDLADPALKLGYRFFFGYDGTLFRAFSSTGKVEMQEFYNVPWSKAIFPQPLPRPVRCFDPPAWVAYSLLVLSGVGAVIRRPFSAVPFLVRGIAKRL